MLVASHLRVKSKLFTVFYKALLHQVISVRSYLTSRPSPSSFQECEPPCCNSRMRSLSWNSKFLASASKCLRIFAFAVPSAWMLSRVISFLTYYMSLVKNIYFNQWSLSWPPYLKLQFFLHSQGSLIPFHSLCFTRAVIVSYKLHILCICLLSFLPPGMSICLLYFYIYFHSDYNSGIR